MTDTINVPIDTLRTMASIYEEKLVAEGHHPVKARRLAMARAGSEVVSACKPTHTERLADRVCRGEATILQLANAIERTRGLGREDAFAQAEHLLSNPGARVAAVSLDPASVGTSLKHEGSMTIVQLADKIQGEEKVDRDTAFARAERILRG